MQGEYCSFIHTLKLYIPYAHITYFYQHTKPWGHHYHTIYQQRLGPFSRREVEPFQFLEIGFFNGGGYDTYRDFLPQGVSQ